MAGSKEFSLLTKLTLSMAGFDKGVDQAKQKTKDLAKGAEAGAASIKSSFGSLSGMTAGLTGSLGGIQSAVTGGIGAFKAMIPAINGIKTALITSGIGAIVVGLGIAFASLASYLSGTSEGANKLKVVFSYISGTVTALLNRIKLLGSAIWKLVTGDWKGMKEDFSKAFASGLLDEIKETAKISAELEKRIQALNKAKREDRKEDADNNQKVAELREKSKDFETYSAKERLGFLNEAIKIEKDDLTNKIALRKEEYDILVAQQKLKTSLSTEDKDKEAELYEAWKNEIANKANTLREYRREEKRLFNEVNTLEKDAMASRMLDLDAEAAMYEKIANTAKKGFAKGSDFKTTANIEGANKAFGITDKRDADIGKKQAIQAENDKADLDPEVQMAKYATAAEKLIGINQSMGESYDYLKRHSDGMTAGIMTATGAMVEAANKGAKSFKDLAKAGANAARDIIRQNLAMAVSNAISSVKGIPFPMNIILAGFGAAGIITLFNAVVPQFANGTNFAPGGLSLVGERGPELVNLPRGSQVFPNSTLNNGLGGEVTFRIEGNALVGVLNNHNKRIRNFG
jgi:hypothetical protein